MSYVFSLDNVRFICYLCNEIKKNLLLTLKKRKEKTMKENEKEQIFKDYILASSSSDVEKKVLGGEIWYN